MPPPTVSRRSTATNSRSRTTESSRPGLPPALTPFLFLLALAACGGEGLLLPSAGQPARIAIVRGDGQTGTVGQPLGDSLVVQVLDPEDRPVEGVEVSFVSPAGAVLAPNDTVLTGANGQAAVHYTLATTAGGQTVEARARPVVPSPSLNTAFHATAVPEGATSLVMTSGDGQTGETGVPLPDSLAVQALDRFGNGVAGIEVTWEANGGSVSPASGTTGADGRAATERTLGDRPGVYNTTASADLAGSPVAFTATGVAPPSPQLVIVTQPSEQAKAGVPFARQPVLQLHDAVGAPLPRVDVAVTVQIADGGGSLGGNTTARSDAHGVVTFTDLSIRGAPGERTLIFAASDYTSATSAGIEVGPGPPVAGASSASVENGTAGAATVINVRLEDAFGTPVEGAADDIEVAVEGANPAADLVVSGRGGGSYAASYTPIRTGTDQVVVRVRGTAVPGSPFASVVEAGPADPATSTASVTRSGIIFINVLVTTRDANGNLLNRGGDQVQVQLNGGEFQTIEDRGDGTYTGSFFVGFSSAKVVILLNGAQLAGSPYTP
ncbi:MAG: filamin/ABP280 repeat domain-containing protein [Gemmatimonadales bacterium]